MDPASVSSKLKKFLVKMTQTKRKTSSQSQGDSIHSPKKKIICQITVEQKSYQNLHNLSKRFLLKCD